MGIKVQRALPSVTDLKVIIYKYLKDIGLINKDNKYLYMQFIQGLSAAIQDGLYQQMEDIFKSLMPACETVNQMNHEIDLDNDTIDDINGTLKDD